MSQNKKKEEKELKPEIGLCIFRRDLRVKHNLALCSALKECKKVIAVYDGSVDGRRALGDNQAWWLSKSLDLLKKDLEKLGVKLFFSKSKVDFSRLAKSFSAQAVYWNWFYLKDYFDSDQKAQKKLEEQGVLARPCQSSFMVEIDQMKNKAGGPFKVFTPFYRSVVSKYKSQSLASPRKAKESSLSAKAASGVNAKTALKKAKVGVLVEKNWTPGEAGAAKKLSKFVSKNLADYSSNRDKLAAYGTSRLSAHLHFGEISPDQIISTVTKKSKGAGAKAFVRQLAWREFCWSIIFNFPEVEKQNYMPVLKGFSWRSSDSLFNAWKTGKTGYPLVDAAMRQLNETGYMENRARMVVASFLVKDLMINWPSGEKWFWNHLVDADPANNVIGWQWVAGCGPDPAPFFRIFNPTLQAKKFDGEGDYIRDWVPELAKLEKKHILQPWKAPEEKLKAAGVVLGKTYPKPIVDHDVAAKKTLAVYKKLK